MTLHVLKSNEAVTAARQILRSREISCADGALVARFKRWGVLPGAAVGDVKKSWDILKSVEFIEQRVPREGAILDLGAYACEMLPALFALRYRNLTGVDLNPRLTQMPHAETIRYRVGNFLETTFADASFDAITAISVIEHGFQRDRLLGEVSRLLRPGGYFIASVDYWHEKIDCSGVQAFGMDWTIFSEEDLVSFFKRAAAFDLKTCGPVDFACREKTVKWYGREYTFAWLVLQKMR